VQSLPVGLAIVAAARGLAIDRNKIELVGPAFRDPNEKQAVNPGRPKTSFPGAESSRRQAPGIKSPFLNLVATVQAEPAAPLVFSWLIMNILFCIKIFA
jgi:hypothetical protein